MESGISNKLKVVWLCNFTNESVQDKLQLRKRVNEYAPWISLGIQEAKNHKDLELHVVSPHWWISGCQEFTNDGIHYHFFNPGIPFWGRRWPKVFRLDALTNYRFNKAWVRKLVEKINPDVIHLHGLENNYYSSTVQQFIGQYPILATIQGFISHQLDVAVPDITVAKRIATEKHLLKHLNHFGVRTEAMKEEVLRYNPHARLHWHEYFLNTPKNEVQILPLGKHEYDLIFFARVTKDKGIEDVIKVVSILKSEFVNLKVAVIGSGNPIYMTYLKQLVTNNGCVGNFDFVGFLPVQKDIYKYLLSSKICIIPTYNDTIPGTIIESMLRKVPVVSYKTGGIPDLNADMEVVLLSNQGDIVSLANHTRKLLTDEKLRTGLAEDAYQYAHNKWNNAKSMDRIIDIYRLIL